MPVPSFDFTVSDTPKLAPADFAQLPPCKLLHDKGNWRQNTYVGSGFLIADLIQGVWWYSEARRCGHCGSPKTLCIYLDNDVAQFDCHVVLEQHCQKCGRFTQYDGAD